MALINISFEVHDSDTPSERLREYKDVVVDALERYRAEGQAYGSELKLADKMLYDAHRMEAAEYDEHGNSSDNKHLEF